MTVSANKKCRFVTVREVANAPLKSTPRSTHFTIGTNKVEIILIKSATCTIISVFIAA